MSFIQKGQKDSVLLSYHENPHVISRLDIQMYYFTYVGTSKLDQIFSEETFLISYNCVFTKDFFDVLLYLAGLIIHEWLRDHPYITSAYRLGEWVQ